MSDALAIAAVLAGLVGGLFIVYAVLAQSRRDVTHEVDNGIVVYGPIDRDG